ncbi:MAG: hypothetical protein JO101_00105 [Candidatus Eremiobacteraeota bacterium]|nr:hypothetical protein [Candidatus Eremiobacteraeota bacterium]
MPLREALDGVRFRPFIPSRQIVETALIPAYNGDDIPEDRGIAFEYVSNRQSFVLSQWPHHGSVISGTRRLGTDHGCPLSAYPIGLKPGHEGVIWNNAVVIASLQPSGDASTKATVDEAHRLVALGACR